MSKGTGSRWWNICLKWRRKAQRRVLPTFRPLFWKQVSAAAYLQKWLGDSWLPPRLLEQLQLNSLCLHVFRCVRFASPVEVIGIGLVPSKLIKASDRPCKSTTALPRPSCTCMVGAWCSEHGARRWNQKEPVAERRVQNFCKCHS